MVFRSSSFLSFCGLLYDEMSKGDGCEQSWCSTSNCERPNSKCSTANCEAYQIPRPRQGNNYCCCRCCCLVVLFVQKYIHDTANPLNLETLCNIAIELSMGAEIKARLLVPAMNLEDSRGQHGTNNFCKATYSHLGRSTRRWFRFLSPTCYDISWNCDLEMCMVEHSDIVRSLLPSNCSMPSSGQCNMCSTKIQDL